MNFDQYYAARDIVEDFLRKDLLGPIQEDEVISDTFPISYYTTGKLYPQETQISQEDMEKNDLEDSLQDEEQPMSMCYSRYPSSMAISFTVRAEINKLWIKTSFSYYVPREKITESSRSGKDYEWHRQAGSFEFNVDTDLVYQVAKPHINLELRVYQQKIYPDGTKIFTVALVNMQEKQMDMIANNAATFFQPEIQVQGENEGQQAFIAKQLRVGMNQDPEVLNLEMLYRHNLEFATGHGCSAGWEADGEYATRVYSVFIPGYELLQMKPALRVRSEIRSFKFLGESSKLKVCTGLKEIGVSYENWIKKQEAQIPALEEKYHSVAKDNLKNCWETLKRIKNGIDLLASQKMVFQAFQLVNRAMLHQRLKQHGPAEADKHSWYPFQLAFILQELCSIVDPQDEYRDVVDLLWFPTGGGKTEAYLGLSAFTIFLRRMRAVREKRPGGGVTIMMRYTLRLLTLQQYERAAALICSCELIRRQNSQLLGQEEIGVGLWVGSGLTPNKRENAARALKKIHEHGFDTLDKNDANPCQILTCPWCRQTVRAQDYTMTEDKMVISCSDKKCEFHRGIPIYVVDQDIYDHGPALVVSTIDKFARMTWEKKVGKLFGLQTEWLPPELIIQDELHLISGPLGTIAGLYEVAVNEFCQCNGIGAKIISSTATIRNAKNQIFSMYGRDFRQFPPQGLDIRDSYFAEESTMNDRPARRYLGILPSGDSGNILLVRVYSALFFATRCLVERGYPQEIVDTFWTITGYFNSLKQLGGAIINVIDAVHGRLKYLNGAKFIGEFSTLPQTFESVEFEELTSRKDNSDIGKTLKRLEKGYPDLDSLDLILASNMLSVGIDIARLGIMVLQGQPKLNSEYIQATSRVGRQTPGMVITMYDASRSRDRSHYEQFPAYHSSLYKYVEATSLTPFAERARDRALHAVLISLCRHLIPGLQDNKDAGQVSMYRSEVQALIKKILERVNLIDHEEHNDTREKLNWILDQWELRSSSDLVYQKYFNSEGIPLLTDRFDGPEIPPFPTLNSMRNVDVESEVWLEG